MLSVSLLDQVYRLPPLPPTSLDSRLGGMESWMNGWAKTSLSYCTFLVVQCVVFRHEALLDVNLGAFGFTLDALGSPATPFGPLWGSLGSI